MTDFPERWEFHPEHFWLRGRHAEQVVRFDETVGLWNVYGFPEAVEIFTDTKRFSSDTTRLVQVEVEDNPFSDGNLMQMDPPAHSAQRRLVNSAFSLKTVAALEDRVERLAHELLDAVEGDELELVADLAYPLPVIVIAELLGVPAGDRDLFKGWVDKMLESTGQISLVDRQEEQGREFQEQIDHIRPLYEYLRAHTVERRRKPREDLLSQLVLAEIDGVRLDDAQIVNFANILLFAGHLTSTMLLGNTVLCLDTVPGLRDLVREDRDRLVPAIEESLRFFSPFALAYRATTEEVEVGGQTIGKDQMVRVWIAAANRDARQFPDPDTFDLSRNPGAHMAFGRGVHFCVGAPLARLEGKVTLNVLLDRFPKLTIAEDRVPTFSRSAEICGVDRLPLRVR
ncbi:cytochrome P450 [Saccharothrix mutabilis subsp. mutabilis]|uniref:Cytochrome P450 n=1 Tax=Saccharothrix mutabilis subsp. mutabilis TaxID=66855 RepID=A0ABN0UEH4_9PSEU